MRSDRDVINKLKDYANEPHVLEALTEFMVFMGVPQGPDFAAAAKEELDQEKKSEREILRAYTAHLRKGSGHYMPYATFKKKYEIGEI